MKDYTEKEKYILKEISEFCGLECGSNLNCSEDNCILYRIEQEITRSDKDV